MKKINKIFICFLVFILVLCMTITFISPISINVYENRSAQKMPLPNIETFINNEFQNEVEAAAADQLPLSSRLKKAYNMLNSFYIVKTSRPFVQANPNKYFKYKTINFFGPNQLVYDPILLDDVKADLDKKIDNLNNVFANNSNVDFNTYFIEKDTDLNLETNQKQGLKEYVFAGLNLPDDQKMSFNINNIEEFRNYFYLTDHHWNYKGSYKAYCELIAKLKPGDKTLTPNKTVLVSNNYSGSKNSVLGHNFFKEDFYAYEFSFPTMSITLNGKPVNDYGAQSQFLDGSRSEISYGMFYGGDDGEIIFNTHDSSKENILIIGESFDNAILKLLATHYNTTYSIDLRSYETYMQKEFDIKSYISEHNIDCVLLIGNINYFVSENFMLR